MNQLSVDPDGIEYGYTAANQRSYKSMNYHRQAMRHGKTLWVPAVARHAEAQLFDESDGAGWQCTGGHYWWVSQGASVKLGTGGQRIAFFPRCPNHPGPWHGYPVAPADDRNYEVPPTIIDSWEDAQRIDDLTAKRMRAGRI